MIGVVVFMTLAGVVLAVTLALRGPGGLAISDRIGVLEITGVITDDSEYLEQLRRFRTDRTIKGILVLIDSPGGVVGPAQSVYRELARMRDEHRIPVVASIGAAGASGGYYIALASDSIYALPGSMTGSIGVIMEFPEISGLLDRVGVEMQVIKSAEHKDAGSAFRPLSPSDRDLLGAVVQDVYDQFVDVITLERELTPEAVRGIADGRILSGQQAMRAGLVDQTGNANDALAAVGRMAGLGEDPRVLTPPRDEFTLLDLVLGRASISKVLRGFRSGRDLSGPRLKFVVPY